MELTPIEIQPDGKKNTILKEKLRIYLEEVLRRDFVNVVLLIFIVNVLQKFFFNGEIEDEVGGRGIEASQVLILTKFPRMLFFRPIINHGTNCKMGYEW